MSTVPATPAPVPAEPQPARAARKRRVFWFLAAIIGVHLLVPLAFLPYTFVWWGALSLLIGNFVFGSLGINLAYHLHTTASMTAWDAAMAQSPPAPSKRRTTNTCSTLGAPPLALIVPAPASAWVLRKMLPPAPPPDDDGAPEFPEPLADPLWLMPPVPHCVRWPRSDW